MKRSISLLVSVLILFSAVSCTTSPPVETLSSDIESSSPPPPESTAVTTATDTTPTRPLPAQAPPKDSSATAIAIQTLETEISDDFSEGKDMILDMLDKNGLHAHPRIIMTEEKFAELRKHIGDDSLTAKVLTKLLSEANRVNALPVCEYVIPDGIRLLETSREVLKRVTILALAYNVFGIELYAKRCYAELEAVSQFKDWNPSHFLDPSEMSAACAIGYDWLYNWMDDEQRTRIRTAIVEKGLSQIIEDYDDLPRSRTYRWYQDFPGDNWKIVCNGGMSMAALAIGDEGDTDTNMVAKILSYAYREIHAFIRRSYNEQDGTYSEGPGYWSYSTNYLGMYVTSLISATGGDYGLADFEGLRKSADFVRYMSSNTYRSFSFGDANDGEDMAHSSLLWLGDYFQEYEISVVRVERLKAGRFHYLDLLWFNEDTMSLSSSDVPTDWGDVGTPNASFRNTWDVSGIVGALHVGSNVYKYHGHYDLGSFYIESGGTRFFTDLGNEDYELPGRLSAYRIRAEGHNTLVINPSIDLDQKEGANCTINRFASGNEAYAISDLTDAYTLSDAKSVIRGLKMIKDKSCVIIQDEISLHAPGEIYWFAHTKAEIQLADDGRSAVLTLGTQKLWVGIISESGTFTIMNATSLPTTPEVPGQKDNGAYKKLSIHLTDTADTTLSVACIPLQQGEQQPLWIPTQAPLTDW